MGETEQGVKEILRLRQRLFFFTVTSACLFALVVALLFSLIRERQKDRDYTRTFQQSRTAPQYHEIKMLINRLEYSGLEDLMRPEVSLSIDFSSKTWTAHNIHRFDKEGKVVLAKGRYGLCGDLAAYVSQKIKPLLRGSYRIESCRASQSGYFLGPDASHIVLFIFKQQMLGEELYILDPTFDKYGTMDDFDDYLFLEPLEELKFVKERSPDETFKVGRATPLIIRNDFLISLLVDEQGGVFDQNNFILTLAATRRFKFAGRYILALRKINGQVEIMENRHLASKLLSKEDYARLKNRVMELFGAL